MVVIGLPATLEAAVTHERVGAPSTRTVQAPHWPSPQPYLLPVNPKSSRRTQRSIAVWVNFEAVVFLIDDEFHILSLRLARG